MSSKKQFILREDESMMTPEFRVSFPRIFETDDNKKFGVAMIFDRDTDFRVLEGMIETKKKEVWPKGVPHPKAYSYPILDGEKSDREEHKDKYYINGKAGKYRPGLVDQNRQEITDPNEFYPGCWARATITLYTWVYMGKCGISVNVRNIQKTRDDEPLITRTKAEDEFESVEDKSVSDL